MGTKFFQAVEWRQAAWQSGFRVKSLAAEMEVDVRTLERWFNESFSTTPKAWLVHERITAALPLLTRGLSNKEVANRLGYTRSANFGRDFKRVFGRTPRDYRRQNQHAQAAKDEHTLENPTVVF